VRPIAPAGKIYFEGVGFVDGNDIEGIRKACFKQKVLMSLLILTGITFAIICVWLSILIHIKG
jgi:hypothetical protein